MRETSESSHWPEPPSNGAESVSVSGTTQTVNAILLHRSKGFKSYKILAS
jgi:hypothetical protein